MVCSIGTILAKRLFAYGDPESRVLKHPSMLYNGLDIFLFSKWIGISLVQKTYCRTVAIWTFYVYHDRGKFSFSASQHVILKPVSASQLVALSYKDSMVRAEYPAPWTYQPLDLDPTGYDPLDNLPACIKAVFTDLVNSPHFLLDQFDLPPDSGAIIAQVINDGETLEVIDDSFDHSHQVGSSAFVIDPAFLLWTASIINQLFLLC